MRGGGGDGGGGWWYDGGCGCRLLLHAGLRVPGEVGRVSGASAVSDFVQGLYRR